VTEEEEVVEELRPRRSAHNPRMRGKISKAGWQLPSQKMGASCAGQAGISGASLDQSKISGARGKTTPLTLPSPAAQVKAGSGDRAGEERERERDQKRKSERERESEKEREGVRKLKGGQSIQS